MAKPRKTASLKTIRENISHLNKMLQRIQATKIRVSVNDNYPEVKIRRFGSRLIINGETYKPADLENLKGKPFELRLQVEAYLKEELIKEEARRYKLEQKEGKKHSKPKHLTQIEVSTLEQGLDLATNDEERLFLDWLNSGSPGWKKNEFYHVYGADAVRGEALHFVRWKGYSSIPEFVAMEAEESKLMQLAEKMLERKMS